MTNQRASHMPECALLEVSTVTRDWPRSAAKTSGTRAARGPRMTNQLFSKIFTFAVTTSAVTQVGCTGDNALDGRSIVLVHGAWMGAWAWDDVKANLEARGATVVAVELPGHGSDMTPLASISLRGYVDTVDAAIDAAPKPVMLVGHSLGGIVVTQAADERADDLDRLVYLTAFVPKDGDSLLSLSMQDPDSELATTLTIDMAQGLAEIHPDKINEVFCADCGGVAAANLDGHYR